MMKLSSTQKAVLELLNKGDILYYMRSIGTFNPNAYWFWGAQKGKVRDVTVRALLRRKLLVVLFPDRESKRSEDFVARITEKGSTLLREEKHD